MSAVHLGHTGLCPSYPKALCGAEMPRAGEHSPFLSRRADCADCYAKRDPAGVWCCAEYASLGTRSVST